MISINNGAIFIDRVHTTNPELIGYAMLDFAESVENDFSLKDIELIKAKGIQDYLLEHGSNDEKINNKIRKMEGLILSDI
jgi:hypothetical protein